MSKGLWGPRTLLTHQPWPVGDTQGTPLPPEDRAPQQTDAVLTREVPGPMGAGRGRRERTGQQELRVRPKRKKVPRGPASMS